MTTRDYILAKFLNCDVFQCSALDSIVLDVDEFFDDASPKTLNGICEAVYKEALKYLTDMYKFAANKLKDNPHLFDGSVLNWDADLLKDAVDYLNPEKDLHWGVDSTDFYMELDNWDLYWSVIDTINTDYDSGMSFKTLDHDFTREFYGGEKTPAKYDDLLV